MAMVSIMASPTNSVREMVFAASGCRAIASIAAATARPSASAGPIAPNDTATAADIMLTKDSQFTTAPLRCWIVGFRVLPLGHRSCDEDHSKDREDIGLNRTRKEIEGHEG